MLLAVENQSKTRHRITLDCGSSKNVSSQLPGGGGGGGGGAGLSVSINLDPRSMALAFQILPIDETKPWNCIWKEVSNDEDWMDIIKPFDQVHHSFISNDDFHASLILTYLLRRFICLGIVLKAYASGQKYEADIFLFRMFFFVCDGIYSIADYN